VLNSNHPDIAHVIFHSYGTRQALAPSVDHLAHLMEMVFKCLIPANSDPNQTMHTFVSLSSLRSIGDLNEADRFLRPHTLSEDHPNHPNFRAKAENPMKPKLLYKTAGKRIESVRSVRQTHFQNHL